jgi:hypothetical protein
MLKSITLGLLILAAVPVAASPPSSQASARETSIPRMSRFLEWEPDGANGMYVRADTGRWYYARMLVPCPRIATHAAVRFNVSPGDRLDRYSSVRAEGWRCQIASVTESGPPPRTHLR